MKRTLVLTLLRPLRVCACQWQVANKALHQLAKMGEETGQDWSGGVQSEDYLPSEQLVEHAAEREPVGATVVGLALT